MAPRTTLPRDVGAAVLAAEDAVAVAIALREGLYRLASPADVLAGWLARRAPIPPLWLRRHIGSASASRYLSIVSDAEALLDELLGRSPIETVLDLGCGCGAMIPYVQRRLPRRGRYLGVDVHEGCLQWCRKRFAADDRLAFRAPPLPAAGDSACGYDLVLAKSLFTHLMPAEAVDCLGAIAERLSGNGQVVLTAFLFDGLGAVPALPNPRQDGLVRHRYRCRPRAAVGFDRSLFAGWLEDAGLEVQESRLWFWPGHHAELSAQDVVVCRRRGARAALASAAPTRA